MIQPFQNNKCSLKEKVTSNIIRDPSVALIVTLFSFLLIYNLITSGKPGEQSHLRHCTSIKKSVVLQWQLSWWFWRFMPWASIKCNHLRSQSILWNSKKSCFRAWEDQQGNDGSTDKSFQHIKMIFNKQFRIKESLMSIFMGSMALKGSMQKFRTKSSRHVPWTPFVV